MKGFKLYSYNLVIAHLQLLNSYLGGSPDETPCARAWINRHRYPYKIYVVLLDAVFYPFQGPGHCEGAWNKELERIQYSREMHEALNQAAK